MTTIQVESTAVAEEPLQADNKTMARASIKVALVGVEARSRRILTRLIASAEAPNCEIVDYESADVIVVDRDGELAERELLALYQHASVPVIVLSEAPVQGENITWVIKPVQANILLQSIWKLAQQRRRQTLQQRRETILAGSRRVRREVKYQLQHRPTAQTASIAAKAGKLDDSGVLYCGSVDESRYLLPRLPDDLFYDPQVHLQSVIQAVINEAQRRERVVAIRGLGRDIVIFDQGKLLATDLSDYQLRRIAASPVDRKLLAFLLLRESSIDMATLRQRAQRTDAVLWKVALWSSRGRLPAGADLDKPISIMAWPNLTRLALFPHAVQLAALWHRQAISMRATAALLNISYRYIFSFYAACLQLGLIRQHARPIVFQPPKSQQPDQGLLGKVLGYLRRKVERR